VAGDCASDQGSDCTLAGDIRVLQDTRMSSVDLELLARWRAGDRRAGNQLIERHFLDLRAYFSLRIPTQYEDLVQETFLQLLKGLDNFRGDAAFHTYLFRIARNVLAAAFRRKYRAEVDPISDSLADVTGQRQSSIMAEREHLRLLLDSLRQLPLAEQELIELYFVQRLPARVLGELFEATEGAIRSRIRTTVGRLRTIYFELAATPHEREVDEQQLVVWMTELRQELRKR
jgi:RNA polymerase sigma-70 factor (ECF subfamily)